VADRLLPSGLRGRLAAAIVLVAVAVLGASFYVLHQRTGANIEHRIDDGLRADHAEFVASPAGQASTPAELRADSRRFVRGQGYHPDSRIFAIEIGDGPQVVTNSEELFEVERGTTEPGEGDAPTSASELLAAPDGLATVSAGGDARVRVLTSPVVGGGQRIGTFRVAQTLSSVDTAQDSLRSAVLAVGGVAVVLLLVAAIWIATLVARPLGRMAAFAADVDTGDLDRRLANDRGPAEVRSLTDSLNRMLDRLQGAFEREREFVADASHELRTPITVAQGELELLRRDAGPQERERLDVVRRELTRMERLISEMLTLAREDAGRSLELREIELDDVLDDLRRDLPLLGARDYRVPHLAGTVDADPDRLAQVVRNLVANAVAHTEVGGRVDVRATAAEGRLRVEVADNGPGIPADEAAHLFERFYRSQETRARDRSGSGLGLAIARAIVEAHGGRIWAEPGPGGRVGFEIPGYRPPDADRP